MASNNSKGSKLILSVILLLVLAVVLSWGIHQRKTETPVTKQSYAMGIVITQTLYGLSDQDANRLAKTINESISSLDKDLLSWRESGSDIAKVNQAGAANVDPLTANCVKQCLEVSKASGGAFDISIGKITTLWGIDTDNARVPSAKELRTALPFVDYTGISVKNNYIALKDGMFLDLGAVGKGLACDNAYTLLKQSNCPGAIVAVAGSVLLYGQNPNAKDGTWKVGIRNPFSESNNDYGFTLTMKEGFLSTSGDYEKILEQDGVTYHHILNPATGMPAESNCTGVTVLAPSGLLADVLSTACYVLGYGDKALDLLSTFHAEGVFILKDGKTYATAGIHDHLNAVTDQLVLQ